jgi:hypothetical protein
VDFQRYKRLAFSLVDGETRLVHEGVKSAIVTGPLPGWVLIDEKTGEHHFINAARVSHVRGEPNTESV